MTGDRRPPHPSTDDASERRADAPGEGVSNVRSLDRAVAILKAFDESRSRMSLSEIAEHLDLNTSTTHRLLQALKAHGLVTQPAGGKAYALGPTVLRLARIATGSLDVQDVARPELRRLRDAIGETAGLHVLRSDLVRVVVDQAESHQALRRSYTELGEPIPLHQGAPGKVLLAWLDEDQRNALLSGHLDAATENTVTDPQALRDDLDAIRARGYAVSYGERVNGIHTVAVAIRDHEGRAVASISVTGPAMRMPADRLETIAPSVAASARAISAALGYSSLDRETS